MHNLAKHYAGQPYMISIWEHMWHRIYTRLDDECFDIEENGDTPSRELLERLSYAESHSDTLTGMLDEAHQLQSNVARISEPMKWKFNLVMKGKP